MNLPKAKKFKAVKYAAGLSRFNLKIAKNKLSANESALGPSPKAVLAFKKISQNLKRYPDTNGNSLRTSLAKRFNLDQNKIILGNGSDQIFELVCKAFLSQKDEVVVSEYSFIIYRIYSEINGAKVKYAKENNFKVSIENILSKVTKKTKIVFIANPNNPTGTYIDKKKILELRKKLRSNILLVIDDAYFEYVKNKNFSSGLKLFAKSKNVIVTRTFSKIYGLAGLRIGWGYASKNIIKCLMQVKPPFNTNSPALLSASAALKDNNWIKKEIIHVNKWRRIMFQEFKKMKIETNEGNANFILIKFDRIKIKSIKVFRELAKIGILVRTMNTYGITNSLRITIGKVKENKKLILKLKKIINV